MNGYDCKQVKGVYGPATNNLYDYRLRHKTIHRSIEYGWKQKEYRSEP